MSNKFLDDAGVVYLFSKVKERDYQSDFELGYYDTITENDDESYTITRQTGYLTYKSGDLGNVGTSSNGLVYFNIELPFNYNYGGFISNIKYTTNPDIAWNSTEDIVVIANTGAVGDRRIYYKQGRTEPIYIQYKLATAVTEKVEANHYARYNQTFILEHNKSEAERSATEGKVVHEKELVDNYITETEINDKLYNYLKVNENGSVLLSSGPLQIFYTDIDFSIYSEQRPNNIINSGDLDVYFFDTGITCRDYEADKYYKYSFPAKSGTFAMTTDIPGVDSSLSSTSTNPVQNKVINSALDGKANKTDITDMTYVVDSSDNAVSLETYGTGGYYVVPTKTYVDTQLTDKQDKLVSGTNIKTINGSTILGSGDITISGGNGGNVGTDPSFNSVIVEQTGAENTGVKLYANRQGDLYSIKRADTSVNRKILTNSDIDPSKVVLTYGITQLYQHHYELEAQPSGDTIYVTCWSTQNTKILLKDITRYAFSNVQVYNSTNDETIQAIKWSSSGFRYINDTGNIDSNGYTVTHYYINGEPTTY